MEMLADRSPFRDACERFSERCTILFPCLSDPVRRSSLFLKVALLLLHAVIVGFLFLGSGDLIHDTRKNPWPTAMYLLLFAVTIMQYFFTSGSSPGYVLDAMKAENEVHATFSSSSRTALRYAARKNGIPISPTESNHLGRNIIRMNTNSWLKLVADLYPPGSSSRSWTCTYCNIVQPPRSRHCHDCDKCVLQFDHHCVWLGTCIGQRNHCRFWWYIFAETVLCVWTGILYYYFLLSKIEKAWWQEGLAILLLTVLIICLIFLLLLLVFHSYLVLTNQTTYELVRRRRIPYLRVVPENVHPFSKGICGNIYSFCCSRDSVCALERVPPVEELQARAMPYTCIDILYARCC
uniref:S-acyltransferase n=1 Tax=Anthurium amnicola TaxID=1678845 RepID=A0A1D1YTG7_9ARAE